jgi:biotin carboxylase
MIKKETIVMFIGAGIYQFPGIKKAKELGYTAVAMDRDRNAPGLKIADISAVLDVKDIDGAIKLAKKNNIDGVLTIASDIAVPTVAAVAEELNLPGIGREVALAATNKAQMREKLAQYGIPSTTFHKVNTLQQTITWAKKIGFPVVIKPTDSAGSRGVTKVNRIEEIKNAFFLAKSFSIEQCLLVEEYMDGQEVAVDAFIYKGKLYCMTVSDKIRTPPPYLLDTTVIFPTNYPEKMVQEICDITRDATFKAVGIDNSPIHVELMMTKDGPKIVELAARGAGFKVFTDIMRMVTGIDTLDASIRLSLGLKPNLSKTVEKASVLKFFDNKPGLLKNLRGVDEAKKLKGIVDLEVYIKPGDIIKPLTCGSDRIGHIITLADTREKAIQIAKKAEKTVVFDVEQR